MPVEDRAGRGILDGDCGYQRHQQGGDGSNQQENDISHPLEEEFAGFGEIACSGESDDSIDVSHRGVNGADALVVGHCHGVPILSHDG